MTREVVALAVLCCLVGIGCGLVIGWSSCRVRDAWILEHQREVARMALDAAAAQAIMLDPSPRQCEIAAQAEAGGYRLVGGW
jgi:hypothetical protein